MDKLDNVMTVTINNYGEEVNITAPAWLLNDISLAYSYWAKYCESKVYMDALRDTAENISTQIYEQLKDAGLYE